MKTKIWLGMIIGSSIGSYIPVLWGSSIFSFTSIILSTIGGMAGVYYGYITSQR